MRERTYGEINIHTMPPSDELETEFASHIYESIRRIKERKQLDASSSIHSSSELVDEENIPESNTKSTQETNELHSFDSESDLHSIPTDGMAAVQAEVGDDDRTSSKTSSSIG